jgi:hypothetical protein
MEAGSAHLVCLCRQLHGKLPHDLFLLWSQYQGGLQCLLGLRARLHGKLPHGLFLLRQHQGGVQCLLGLLAQPAS